MGRYKMKQDELKKIIDGIIIPEQKLKMCLKSKKNPKRYYKFLTVPIVICLTITIFSLRKDKNIKEATNIDTDYFITNIYANEKNYNIEKPVQIDMTEDMFGTSWEVSSIINSDESGYNGKSYLPFDIVVTGDNIKEITYSVLNGDSLNLYLLESFDEFQGDYNQLIEEDNGNTVLKKFNEFQDKDLKMFKEKYSSVNDLEQYYHDNFFDMSIEYDKKMVEANFSQDSLKEYGWIYWIRINHKKELKIPYDKQFNNQSKMQIITNFSYGKDELSYYKNEKNLIRFIKDELLNYQIKMEIKYNNGVIKEKNITFIEVPISEEDMRPGDHGSRIYLQIL